MNDSVLTQYDTLDGFGGRQADEDCIGGIPYLRRRSAHSRAKYRAAFHRSRVRVVDMQIEACLQKMPDHMGAHGTEADETDIVLAVKFSLHDEWLLRRVFVSADERFSEPFFK